ncbi:hypothetical protein MNBD_UNCLBAC01-1901 [hydrothermal vent metagenome]|uniref:DUF3137 domain-containing protein n=1 Tax=hydrothermal vent metagenome TaxID=652676 RepID=A0A3B1DKS2_9ZZZZ
MTLFIVVTIIILVVGIVFLGAQSPIQKKTRHKFLAKFANFTEGKAKEIEGRANSFCVQFAFEGQDFVFEDIEETGFSGFINKGYLKVKTKSALTLHFMEKEGRMGIRSDIIKMSDVEKVDVEKERLKLPKTLDVMQIFTNDVKMVNALLAEERVAKIFTHFKNKDSRGAPFLALKVTNGEVILEFCSKEASSNPALSSLHDNISLMETYADQLLVVTKKLNELVV